MPTIVYVHGIANRGGYYVGTIALLEAQLNKHSRNDINVVPCNWSDTYGGRLPTAIRSIPGNDEGSLTDIAITDSSSQLWRLLDIDPLFEIDELKQHPPESPTFVDAPQFDETLARLSAKEDPQLNAILSDAGLSIEIIMASAAQLTQATSFADALCQKSCIEITANALSRAIVAQGVLLSVEAEASIPPRAADRTRASIAIANRLLTSTKFLGQKLASSIATSVATRLIQGSRKRYTRMLMPFVGDVLVYQTHGAKIRQLISNVIQKQPGPVTLLAHSLGGVACVDLLSHERLGQVAQLITVGSQAGFFAEMGILQAEYLQIREDFPPWMNIFDRADFLSFLAKPVFVSAKSLIQDIEVKSHEDFPASHSSYFENDEVWSHILSTFTLEQ